MLISNIEKVEQGDYCELRAVIETSSLREPFVLWHRFPAEISEFIDPQNGDPFVAFGLLPAMRTGESLVVSVPISPLLLRSVKKIQDIYNSWDPTLSRVVVCASERDVSPPSRKSLGVGLFFSLGVDSFYSLLKSIRNPGEAGTITHLIVVHGFDVHYRNSGFFTDVLRNALRVGQEYGKGILSVVTNLRDFSDQFASWPKLYHGAAMAIVGLHLQYLLQTIFIASTHSYEQLHPHGSHPELDPLWSTEHVSFVHHGCEAKRIDKIRFIADTPIVLKTLRACWINPNNEYNCGRCEKCLRTMIGLYIAGVLERCETLPHDPE